MPSAFKHELLRADGLVIGMEHVVVIGVTIVLCGLRFALFRCTRICIAMQAASRNPLAAYYIG